MNHSSKLLNLWEIHLGALYTRGKQPTTHSVSYTNTSVPHFNPPKIQLSFHTECLEMNHKMIKSELN